MSNTSLAVLPSRRTLDIVICDNCKPMRDVLHEALVRERHRVTCASGGSEARKLLLARHPPPDLLLLDYCMPNMNGLELLLQLREAGFHGRVVLMTAWPDPMLANDCMQAGAHAFLAKPFSLELLLKIVSLIP